MKIITIKSYLLKLVESRRKVQTIRKNSQYYNHIKPGDIGFLTDYRKKLKIKITNAYVKKREELTEEEAIMDGFFSLAELLPFITHDEVKVIRFELVTNL